MPVFNELTDCRLAGIKMKAERGLQKENETTASWSPRHSDWGGADRSLCSGLMLRWHAVANWHTSILPTGLLLLLQVLVVRHLLLLLVGHVSRVHAGRTRHVGRLSGDIAVVYILGSLCWDLGGIDTVLGRGRVGGVKASLSGGISNRLGQATVKKRAPLT